MGVLGGWHVRSLVARVLADKPEEVRCVSSLLMREAPPYEAHGGAVNLRPLRCSYYLCNPTLRWLAGVPRS